MCAKKGMTIAAKKSVAAAHGYLGLLVLGLVVVTGSGCATYKQTKYDEKVFSQPPVRVLVPGDELEVTFFGAPDLNVIQKVRSDGFITLRLAGEVQATGRTPAELEKELRAFYDSQLQQKEVSVIVRTPAPVYVLGSVNEPGRVPMDHRLTALHAVMAAGGFDRTTARVKSVVVLRHEGRRREGFVLDMRDALRGESNERESFYLKPFDVVYVPRKNVVRVNQWVDQYINRMLPRLGLRYDSDGDAGFYR